MDRDYDYRDEQAAELAALRAELAATKSELAVLAGQWAAAQRQLRIVRAQHQHALSVLLSQRLAVQP